MDEHLRRSGHEPVDSISPIDALKARMIEMAKIGKNPNKPSQNAWKSREIHNGFKISYKSIFIPDVFVSNEEDDLSEIEPNDSNSGLAVLVRDISSLETEEGSKSEPFITYMVRIGEGEDPVIIIDRKSINNLNIAKDAGVDIGEVEDLLTDIISEDGIHFEPFPVIKLTDSHNDFLQKLLNSLDDKQLELVEDNASSDN
ncbi:hypothetical protein A3F29_01335 [Candidatus Roizmanbacteria bacterium RIFCSPHIGHO2_12_FULL_33_9]|uniref:Uncharacterized protein n=1 Tax=Candidatus Roizmanbacteria bacterium RIFCSPHIGHO2_12_FULL_33_9 TaxID=1802045 RepID=A0A1F7HK23_9BACT|nr:MAG: hypothetical protein A3F29_01335 [Candidatus Roizmanbacteria bacterium RIFCSPHIGHO2_12_FULL_33_9]